MIVRAKALLTPGLSLGLIVLVIRALALKSNLPNSSDQEINRGRNYFTPLITNAQDSILTFPFRIFFFNCFHPLRSDIFSLKQFSPSIRVFDGHTILFPILILGFNF
jgi:hypothetical protein